MTLSLTQPDDWHLHLRDGPAMAAVLPLTARQFRRAIVMPNLAPPVTTTVAALAYRERILAALPVGATFEPLMTLYLTDNTSVDEIRRAAASGRVVACKLYPAGATTNADAGVTRIEALDPVLGAMTEAGLPLLVHGEVTSPDADIFDREALFIDRVLAPLVERMDTLKVVFEHITTRAAAAFVEQAPARVAATLTPQHLLLNRNALLAGAIRPHHYCLPVLKREQDRAALLAAATSGNPKFFLGTDSAPHARAAKESACGCAGVFSAHAAMALYAEAFESVDALDRLEGFASFHGADFYGLPRNTTRLSMARRPWRVDQTLRFGDETLVPWRAGEQLAWQVTGTGHQDR